MLIGICLVFSPLILAIGNIAGVPGSKLVVSFPSFEKFIFKEHSSTHSCMYTHTHMHIHQYAFRMEGNHSKY